MNDAKTAKVFAELERAESKLTRAFNRWVKAKAAVKRLDRAYARQLAESVPVHDLPPGGPKPWPNDMEGKPKARKKGR